MKPPTNFSSRVKKNRKYLNIMMEDHEKKRDEHKANNHEHS